MRVEPVCVRVAPEAPTMRNHLVLAGSRQSFSRVDLIISYRFTQQRNVISDIAAGVVCTMGCQGQPGRRALLQVTMMRLRIE